LRVQRFDRLMPRAVHLARAELLRSIGPILHRLTLDDLAAAVRIALRLRSLIRRMSANKRRLLVRPASSGNRSTWCAVHFTRAVHLARAWLLPTIRPIPRPRRAPLLGAHARARAKSGS
jgi:hypothetical protein